MENEVWKNIEWTNGIYQVSNFGRVRTIDRYVTTKNGRKIFCTGQVLIPTKNQDGYLSVHIKCGDSRKTFKVHRLVGDVFLDKPSDFSSVTYEINHKDCHRNNNKVENLDWITHKDNVLYSVEKGHYVGKSGMSNPNYGNRKLSKIYAENKEYAKQKQSRPGAQNGKAHKVALYDENWNYIKTFDCLKYCAEYLIANGFSKSNPYSLGINISTAISKNKFYLKHYFKSA